MVDLWFGAAGGGVGRGGSVEERWRRGVDEEIAEGVGDGVGGHGVPRSVLLSCDDETTEMEDPGAGSRGPPAGAVVVPVEAAAPAPAAATPAAGTRPAWTRVRVRVRARARARVTLAGAAARLTARLAWAVALFLLGCAAAGLAFFAMILAPPADSRHQGKAACAPLTDAEAADQRAASEYLLLAASAQVLVAIMGLLVPTRPVAAFGCLVGWLTAYRATDLLWMLFACQDTAHAFAFHFWLFFAVLCAALLVGAAVSIR